MTVDQINANGENKANLPVEFQFRDHLLRAFKEGDDICAVANDVCAALELKNPTQVLTRLDDDEKGVRKVDTRGGPQELAVVTLSGLTRLIARSNKPQARAFQRWLFHDVVPSIYKTGRYETGRQPERPELENVQHELRIPYPDEGRYVLTISPEKKHHIYKVTYDNLITEEDHLNIEILALAVRSIEAFWQKSQHLVSVGLNPGEGFVQRKLEGAITHAAGLAAHFLSVYGRRRYEL